jgi:hypothetical protein
MVIGLRGIYCRVSISEAHCTKVSSHAAQCLSVIAPYASYNGLPLLRRYTHKYRQKRVMKPDLTLKQLTFLNGYYAWFFVVLTELNQNNRGLSPIILN